MGGGAGDSGRVGGLSFGGSKGPSKDKSKDKGNAAAPAKSADKGFFGGLKDFFSGGGKGSDRPRARPEVLKTGTGKDTRYLDTKTGKSYAAPSYGAFSFKGLTSTDPANVARNRYGAERAMAANQGMNDRDRGIASLVAPPTVAPPTTEPVVEKPTPPTPEELAAIGAPTTPMGPIFVDSPAYTQYDSLDVLGPVGGYGTAFGPMGSYGGPFVGNPQPLPINWMDIFNTYPDFNTR